MNVNKIGVYSQPAARKNDKQNAQPVAFKGARMQALKYALNINKTYDTAMFKSRVSAIFNMKPNEIEAFTKGSKKHKMKLLYRLSDKYNAVTYNNQELNSEKTKALVFDIYNKIKYPNNSHLKLIDETNYSFEQLNKIFDITEKDPKKLELADNLLFVYPYTNSKIQLPFETLQEFLTTKSSKKIARNFEEYKPYIILNVNDKNIVKNLEEQIAKGYNRETYFKKLNVVRLFADKGVINDINPDLIEANYKPEGIQLLKNLNRIYSGDYNFNTADYQNKIARAASIMDIYNSTTPQNFAIRNKVFDFVKSHVDINQKFAKAPLDTVEKIFKKIDAEPETRKFVEATVGEKSSFESIAQIDDALTNADLAKLNSRIDLVQYALLNRINLVEFSKKDFNAVDKQIKASKIKEKREMDKAFYSQDPFIMDMHRLKDKIKRFFERYAK